MGLGAALAITVVIVLGWPFLRHGDPFNRELARHHLSLVHEAKAMRGEVLPVVTIGASGIDRAILSGEQFATAATEAGLPPMRLVRLVAPGGIEKLDENLVSALVELRPEILLVQDHALFYDDLRSGYGGFSNFCKDRLVDLLGLRKGRRAPAKRLADFYSGRNDRRREISAQQIEALRVERRRTYTGLREDVLLAMELCHQAGTRVCILPIVGDPRAEIIFDDDREANHRHLTRIVASGMAEVLSCPITFTEEDYLDIRHHSSQGRARYTRWLLSELAPKLKP